MIKDGVVSAFMAVPDVLFDGNERGLFSMAFPSDYAASSLFYVYYTRSSAPERRDPGGRVPPPGRRSRRSEHPERRDHDPASGRSKPQRRPTPVRARRDALHGHGRRGRGRRSVPSGDESHGSARKDPADRSQAVGRRPVHDPGEQSVRSFGLAPRPEIWSYGVRNPWRFTFDRVTGDFNLADVGQNLYEEIDYRPVGLGWGRGRTSAGAASKGGTSTGRNPYRSPPASNIVPPILEYSHSGRNACSITGGYVVRDQEVPSLLGRYLYTDLCNGASTRTCWRSPTRRAMRRPAWPSFSDDIRRGLLRPRLRRRAREREQRVPHPPDGPAGAVLHPQYDLPVLTAHVEDDFTIHLQDPNGQYLDGETLPQGAYSSSSTTTRRSTTSI